METKNRTGNASPNEDGATCEPTTREPTTREVASRDGQARDELDPPYAVALARALDKARVRRGSRLARVAWPIAMLLVLTAIARADRDDGDDRDYDDDVSVEIDLSASASPVRVQAPPIAEVLEAAYAAAGLDHDPTRSWMRRARIAGLVPWVTVRTGWDQNWRDDDPDVGRSRTFEVRATWRLDRLLFDGRELQISSVDAARRRERRRLARAVIAAYFAWRRVTSVAAAGSLAVEAATATLDALTDGWFSDRAKARR